MQRQRDLTERPRRSCLLGHTAGRQWPRFQHNLSEIYYFAYTVLSNNVLPTLQVAEEFAARYF